MNVLQISDIHYRKNYEANLLKNEYYRIVSRMKNPISFLELVIDDCLQKYEIDLLILSGDLTESGEVNDYQDLRNYFDHKLPGIQKIVCLGNHDQKDHFVKGWLGKKEPLIEEEYFYTQVIHKESFAFISFDNSKFGFDDGYMDGKRLMWLRKTLDEIGNKPSILILHHHLLNEGTHIPALINEELMNIIQTSNIVAVLGGHTHYSYETSFGNKKIFVAPSCSFQAKEMSPNKIAFQEAYGYHVYKVENQQIDLLHKELFIDSFLGNLEI